MRRPLRSNQARAVANLAIDLGDPGRMAKARRLHRGNSVGTVDITHLRAETTVTDPAGELFDVSIIVASPAAEDEAPLASTVSANCACDDDSDVCNHALAAILGIAEEIEANGRLLAIFGGTEAAPVALSPVERSDRSDSFFHGAWTPSPSIEPLNTLNLSEDPVLTVDGVDAGPVVVEARAAIRRGLTRYRARR